jgi:hypothetical protein
MSWSDTTPAPTVAGTPSYLAPVRRAEPNANIGRDAPVIEQPVNLSTVPYLGVFSRAEQRVLQAIFKAIAEGGGRCVATLAMLARESNTSKSTTRNAIAQAVAIGLLKRTERRSYCAVSLPNILTYGKALTAPHLKATHEASPLPRRIVPHADRLNQSGR